MLKRRYILTLALLGCFALVTNTEATFATTAIVPSDREMVVESRAIVRGRVVGLSTGVEAKTDRVYTYIRLQVNTVLKGQNLEQEIVLRELGGETRDRGTLIFGMPRFEQGQDVLVYLDTWPDGALRVHQGFLGKFNISRDQSTGSLFVERQPEGEVVAIRVSSNDATDRSELDAYTQNITSLMKTNRMSMREFDKYYDGVPMLAQPVEYASSYQEITPQFSYLNPNSPARWFEADSNRPVVFYVNPTGAPSVASVQEDIQAAMNAWSTAGVSIRVSYGGTTSGCGVNGADGINTISFNNCDNYFAPSQGCSGLLAVSGIIRYLPNETKSIGGATFAKAVEANMSFNPYAFCNISSRCELQEVATHEFGHALGLGHSSDSHATMFPYAHYDNRGAALLQDDLMGIRSIYPGTPGATRLSISTTVLPANRSQVDYGINLEANGGDGGYKWDLVSGTLPPGILFSMGGLLYGKTGEIGNFDLTVQVRDSSGNVSQRVLTLSVKPPSPAPTIVGAEYKKKKILVFGSDFQPDALVYVNGAGLQATFDGARLTTKKKKLKPGTHELYVLNTDGKQSNTFLLVIQ